MTTLQPIACPNCWNDDVNRMAPWVTGTGYLHTTYRQHRATGRGKGSNTLEGVECKNCGHKFREPDGLVAADAKTSGSGKPLCAAS